MTLRLAAGMATHIGRVRAVNQDAAATDERVVVVADGMGGHNGGEVASRIAVDTFLAAQAEPSIASVVAAVDLANDAILERAEEEPGLVGMGTTLCALAVVSTDEGERLCVANVGDSRVYVLADGALEQISEDHSLVAGLVRQGRLRAEDAERHPQRNILTRALGVEPQVLVDAWEVVPVAGDRFLLCSDGLFNEVPDDRIAAVLRRLADPQEAAEELVRLANEGGGRDNVTVVVADLVTDATRTLEPGSTRLARSLPAVVDVAGFTAAAPVDEEWPTVEPPTADAASPPPGGRRHGRARRSLRVSRPTWRSLLFVVLVAGVAGVAAATFVAFSSSGTFVGADRGEVVIFDGRPDGFLWLEPSVTERSGLDVAELAPEDRAAVEAGVEQDSLGAAQTYVEELRLRAQAEASTATTTTTTTTTVSTTTAVPVAPPVAPPDTAPPGTTPPDNTVASP